MKLPFCPFKSGKLHLQQLSEDKKRKGGKGNTQKSKVFNEQGKMVFSKFDFTASDGSNKEKKKPGLDAKSALARLEAQKKGLAAEQVRLQTMIAERDAEIKVRIFKRNRFRSDTRHYPISFIRIICLSPIISCISKSALACSLE